MRTADLDFIKVTEVGGIVRYSSKPPEESARTLSQCTWN